MENEEFCLKTLQKDDESIRFRCKTNEILTFRVPKREQNRSMPYENNGKQGNGLAAGRRGPFFVHTSFFVRTKKVAHMIIGFSYGFPKEFPKDFPYIGYL